MLKEKILMEYDSIQDQIDQIQRELKKLPEGKLLITRNGKYQKWYAGDGHKKVYIPKRNRRFAEQLAQKNYLMSKLQNLRNEKQALDACLQILEEKKNQIEEMPPSDSEYAQLLSSYFSVTDDALIQWAAEDYNRNTNYPEHLIHKTSSGILVRSKSEAMIERFLYTNRIPFRYECALCLDPMIFYPDFTIMHPKTREIYYWEHFGRMDDISYSEKAFAKLRTYAAHGLIPSVQLITTYETKRHPMSYEDIEKIGTHYFLE